MQHTCLRCLFGDSPAHSVDFCCCIHRLSKGHAHAVGLMQSAWMLVDISSCKSPPNPNSAQGWSCALM